MKPNQSAKRVNIVSIKLVKEGSAIRAEPSTDRMTVAHERVLEWARPRAIPRR